MKVISERFLLPDEKGYCRFRKIEIADIHAFSKPLNGYKISPYLQELMTNAGQLDCYNHRNKSLSKFTGIDVSAMQVHRGTDTYGNPLE